jgi:hypothetical protein
MGCVCNSRVATVGGLKMMGQTTLPTFSAAGARQASLFARSSLTAAVQDKSVKSCALGPADSLLACGLSASLFCCLRFFFLAASMLLEMWHVYTIPFHMQSSTLYCT